MIKKDPMLKDNPITQKYINKLSNNKWGLNEWTNDIKIDVLTLLPHKNAPILEKLIELNPDAIILKTYGIGNAPVSDTEFVNTLKKAIAKGIIIVNNTQCLYGGVNQNYYHTGKELKTLGIIGSKNMTDAAVYSKLFYLISIIILIVSGPPNILQTLLKSFKEIIGFINFSVLIFPLARSFKALTWV